eukprot:TRINITY_DN6711_c0_g1_i1.p1 TRINITY_DN6711_c0_g1~~TRINITY_DN6711_c0_g1_i1.p1  ORF type:complete len:613 (+),score=97.20 TRINITY_DN6711_c0_g1_i1:80-1918(+)
MLRRISGRPLQAARLATRHPRHDAICASLLQPGAACGQRWRRHASTPEEPANGRTKELEEQAEQQISAIKRMKPMVRDYIELWSPRVFWLSAAGLNAGAAALVAVQGWNPVILLPTAAYAFIGMKDVNSTKTLRRNFPALIRLRYLAESIRPEIRQYFIESNSESSPISRDQRTLVYQRSKTKGESTPFGTTLDVYESGYEWVSHSNLGAKHIDLAAVERVLVGAGDGITPYNASRLNISAMSYGALSHAAIKSLNWGARLGGFYHNTGEGGVSDHHRWAEADVVWNIGTGYFGARNKETGEFSEEAFLQTLERTPTIKMIEVKLSQGAKPGHGGVMPASKLTPEIAEMRGVPMGQDVLSPPWHSAFQGPLGLVRFTAKLKKLSGRPVGFKMCVGQPMEAAAIVKALKAEIDASNGISPVDFITVDGGEGGTGAAPLEFSNRVGMPMREGLALLDDLLRGAGIREHVRVIASGKIVHSYSMIRACALGADACNSARAFMLSLGCIQARKCNTNHCPTGIATQDENLIKGLDVPNKAIRVKNFHDNTMHGFAELLGACGVDSPDQLTRSHIMKRISQSQVLSYEDLYPTVQHGALLSGTAPPTVQTYWNNASI